MTNRLTIGAREVEHFRFGQVLHAPRGSCKAVIDFLPGDTYLVLSSSASARELEAAARQAAEALERLEAGVAKEASGG